VPCICWALSLFRFVPPNVILFVFGRGPAAQFLGRFGPLFDAIWPPASAANDLLIAGTLVILLYRRRNAGLGRSVPAPAVKKCRLTYFFSALSRW
jgi:hypothetical protein